MDFSKLSKWAELLLDTGKRNNLINFRDTKLGTVDVVAPDFSTLFSKAEHSAVFEVFDPKLENQEEDFDDLDTVIEYSSSEKYIPKKDYLNAYLPKVKKNQILLYNYVNKPIQALNKIGKKAKSAIEETGVNIAYLAFCFIYWKEKETDENYFKAPLLLAPIAIMNESPIEPFYVKVTDDEIIVNPTFNYKLQNEYGLKLPDFDEDLGIDQYLLSVRELLDRLNWKVSSECKIGIFSFLKINMYKDLKDNAEKVAESKDVQSLLGEFTLQAQEQLEEEQAQPKVSTEHKNVVDADASQQEAIEMAKSGKSFVLQGPPGTGKSQTITNVIAESLADGKKVLFVSEKLAALSVVYDKLKNAGLEEFCLELHSHKANKKEVIQELCHTLKKQKCGVSDKAEKEIKLKEQAQSQLDGYASELHKVEPIINKSLYQLFEDIAEQRHIPPCDYLIKDVDVKGEEYLDKSQAILCSYANYSKSVGKDYRKNVWQGYVNTDCSYQTVRMLKESLTNFASDLKDIIAVSQDLTERYGIQIKTLAEARAFKEFFNLARLSSFLTPTILEQADKFIEPLRKMRALAEEVLANKSSLDKEFDKDVYQLDGQAVYKKLTRQFNGFFSRLFNAEYKKIILDFKLCKNDGKKPCYKKAVEFATTLKNYQNQIQDFNELEQCVKDGMGSEYKGVKTNFVKCIQEVQALIRLKQSGIDFAGLCSMHQEDYDLLKPVFKGVWEKLDKALLDTHNGQKYISQNFDKQEYDLEENPLESLKDKLLSQLDNLDKLDNWTEFYKLIKNAQSIDLRDFIDFAIKEELEPIHLAGAFKRALCSQWADHLINQNPKLHELSRIPHDQIVETFIQKDQLNFEINKAIIKANLCAERPNLDMVAQGSGIAILLREGEKKRKQKGIRTLFSEIGELVQTLKPCFLMSPLSVSTYLSPEMKFDLVVFDEASQIFPQDAIGAIYRGKQLIVVGDSKQMPPSNFFNTTIENEDDEEDITDFESILDLCSTTFPQRRLKWHYRSRYEQLISFSNKNFYDNDLVTFPSVKEDQEGIGVDYIFADGIFDRTSRTNRIEAEKIVDMVYEHIEKYPDRSLGVVAFSISQQNLIDKLISKRRQAYPSKEWFFRTDKQEPFFVKNLETVQGDERDTIMFSVAYAKDEQGKLLLNFGPINREGGERRLNVAVTRAKHNVQLVSSMHYYDIDLSRTKSEGARLLREYLDYAENGEIALVRKQTLNQFGQQDNSSLIAEVKEFLTAMGFKTEEKVGSSSFKIDLAVQNEKTGDFVLAIECDGDGYKEFSNTRDRDRLRKEVLERMGWKHYRLWSTDWFRNKSLEKERLLEAVNNALINKEQPKEQDEQPLQEISFEQEVSGTHFEFPKYQMVDVYDLSKKCKDVARMIKEIVSVEAPISEEWLLKRICFKFGREKVTSVVEKEFHALTYTLMRMGVERKNGFLYLAGEPITTLRVPNENDTPREPKYIDLKELANGIKDMLKLNVTAQKAGLFRLIASQLGYSRVGEALQTRLESALALLGKEIEISNDMISLKS